MYQKKEKKSTKSGSLSPLGERCYGAWAHSQKDSHAHK